MTKRPAAAGSEFAAAQRDVLLATKLHVPGRRPGFVPRPRLADRLDEGLGRGLVLVCAPAGFGKTALLADWARCGRRPVAWLSLDAGDNDPARFWRHAVAALDGVYPGIGERVGPLLGPPAPSSFEGLVTALINELAAQPRADEVLLVLDDYHLARTEGWASGLQLAGLSLRGRADAAGFVAAFTGSHRYVLDYLAEEVLDGQTEQMRAFLLETSVLERLSGELCDAVTGRSDGQAMLEQVERAGLFLVPLDEVRGWWRYHHLFADLLRARLQQQQPDRVAALHRAAATWSDEHSLADDAVRHALAAGDAVWAAWLIERHFDALLLRGEGATIQRWLAALSPELIRSRLRLLLAQAWLALTGGDVEGAGPPLDAAERVFADAANEAFEPTAGIAGSLLVNVPAAIALFRAHLAQLRGDAEGTAAHATQALAVIGEGERLLDSVTRLHLAGAEYFRGRLNDAERALSSSIAQWQASSQLTLIGWGCYGLGQVQRAQGRLDAAHRTYQQTLEITAPPGRLALPVAGIAKVGLAEVAYQRNGLDVALRYVTDGIALCRRLNFTPPLAAGLVTLAWIRQATGDPAGALDAMAEAERAAAGPPGLTNQVLAQRARLLLAQGDIAAAVRWTKERGLAADDEPAYPGEPEYLVLARVLLVQDHPGAALTLLERLHVAAVSQDRAGSVIEIQALQALALAAAGEETAAVDALAGALILACPQGYVRVFADEGPPMAALLGRLVAAQRAEQAADRGVEIGCLAGVLGAFDGEDAMEGAGRSAAAVVPGLVEQLTARELEVLVLLAAGTPNPRIAEQLVVTLDTVKKHVSHLLGKLGAANRTEAVTRARQLGLIP
ncbi:MAG TPA: LuxR C-terminal-related transcriptional regulator [Streptosporangiaceae bacterium]|nr:LuxR C-terminal-related transcriptional regulator [Streptosporangiaceae bacterium]